MERMREKTVAVIKYGIMVLSGCIVAYLCVYSMLRTVTFYDMELPFFIENDNLFFNILAFAVIAVCIMLTVNCLDRVKWLTPTIIILIECVVLGGLCLAWCFLSKAHPAADQYSVIKIAKILTDSGQYDAEKTAELVRYIQMFPYQIGLVSCYQMIFRIFGLWYSTEEVHIFNVLCYMASLFFMSHIVYILYQNKKVLYYQVITTMLFAPWFFMMPFCYGDMPSLMFSLGGVYCYLQYERKRKRKYAILSVPFFCCSCIVKPNGIIFVIAMFCMLIIKALQKKEVKWLFYGIVLLLLSAMSLPTIKFVYNARYQLHMEEGSPVYGNMLMGLSESFNAGRYTGYVVKVYDKFAPDTKAMSQDALLHIQERLEEFSKDIPYTVRFFKEKIATEYAEPTYEAILNNKYYGGESEFVNQIYYGQLGNWLTRFLNRYQVYLYIMSLFYIIYLWKQDADANQYLFILYFLGIFLLQIVWEAQGRYVLPSIICLIPCVSYSGYRIETIVHHKIRKKIERKK